MCGICGFSKIAPSADTPALLSEMAASIAHRGPDGQGTWISPDGTTGLANTRLAIIDIEGGKQPIHTPDGRFTIVFNGELYNFAEIRGDLEARGTKLLTNSDTEIVLAAYREWGESCLERFRGMFAVAIFDNKDQELFVARDRTGIKPLYYCDGPRGFYFGSELKAILKAPGVPRQLNYQALSDFLVLGYPVLPKTFFVGIDELEPGTWLKVSQRVVTSKRYWSWRRAPSRWTEPQAFEESEKAIIDSLREHLVADVPVGAFLSGGIDSSLLVALLVKALGRKPQVFTVAFPEARYDESPFARIVANHLGIPHTEIVLDANKGDVSLVNQTLSQFDQPFGDSSAIPTGLICREIRKAVKVAIGGDGGDEMFGGYERFWYADVARRLDSLPAFCVDASRRVLQPLKAFAPETCRRSDRLLRAMAAKNGARLVALSCYVYVDKLTEVLDEGVLRQIEPYVPSLSSNGSNGKVGGGEFIDSTISFALPGDYLRKVDVMSGAHGLEVRVPFLGEHVLACSAQIPEQFKYSRRQNKMILRRLAEKYLPKEIVNKPKWGFGIPLDSWLGQQGREEIHGALSSPKARIAPLISRRHLESLLPGFVSQNPDLSRRSRFNTYQQVYGLWALELWLNQWNPTL